MPSSFPEKKLLTKESLGKQELKTQFVELRTRGLSYSKIAKRLKVSKAILGSNDKNFSFIISGLDTYEPKLKGNLAGSQTWK
jgi:hypothetical protein